jgi:penicillin-binding protein 2
VSGASRVARRAVRARRIGLVAAFSFVAFSILLLRLWSLQVLGGTQAVGQARANRSRIVAEPAPRGDIVDREGRLLATDRMVASVGIQAESLSLGERRLAAAWGQRARRRHGRAERIPPPLDARLARTLRRLGRVVGVSEHRLNARVVTALAQVPYADVTLVDAVSRPRLAYLAEHRERFPGIVVGERPRRSYPHGDLAAHVLGTTGEIARTQLGTRHFTGVRPGTVVGQDGVEWTYDAGLRGVAGRRRYTVDADGSPVGQRELRRPRAGGRLRLTLDLGLQRAGERALRQAIAVSGGTAGAFVALDPRNGALLALGSAPSFDPRRLQRPLTPVQYERLLGAGSGAPRFDRAIGAAYPTGSVFKPITALAGQAASVLDQTTVVRDRGCITIAGRRFCNTGAQPNGPVDLRTALRVSSDVYFYVAGRDMDALRGEPLQRWARRLGLGRRTGVDLPGEFAGLVPDRAWRASVGRLEDACERRRRVAACGISDKRPWSVGDNVNLAIGQGDLQATPLQVAVGFAAIANGGWVVAPHVGAALEDRAGRVRRRLHPPVRRRTRMDAATLSAIRDGLHQATSETGGTSADVFAGWPQERFPVYGKTGTAERPPNRDQSWYAAYVPDPARPLVVVTTVENGGFGAAIAAPAARLILGSWFGVPSRFVAGDSETR